jgi:hypothetical protein
MSVQHTYKLANSRAFKHLRPSVAAIVLACLVVTNLPLIIRARNNIRQWSTPINSQSIRRNKAENRAQLDFSCLYLYLDRRYRAIDIGEIGRLYRATPFAPLIQAMTIGVQFEIA